MKTLQQPQNFRETAANVSYCHPMMDLVHETQEIQLSSSVVIATFAWQ